MSVIEEIETKLRECINHAYRDKYEDMQTFGSNVKHLDKAMILLNELVDETKEHSRCHGRCSECNYKNEVKSEVSK